MENKSNDHASTPPPKKHGTPVTGSDPLARDPLLLHLEGGRAIPLWRAGKRLGFHSAHMLISAGLGTLEGDTRLLGQRLTTL